MKGKQIQYQCGLAILLRSGQILLPSSLMMRGCPWEGRDRSQLHSFLQRSFCFGHCDYRAALGAMPPGFQLQPVPSLQGPDLGDLGRSSLRTMKQASQPFCAHHSRSRRAHCSSVCKTSYSEGLELL